MAIAQVEWKLCACPDVIWPRHMHAWGFALSTLFLTGHLDGVLPTYLDAVCPGTFCPGTWMEFCPRHINFDRTPGWGFVRIPGWGTWKGFYLQDGMDQKTG